MAIVPTGAPVKVTRYDGAPGLGGSVSGKAPAQRQVPNAKPVRVRQPKVQGKASRPPRVKPIKVVPIQGEPKNQAPFTKPATGGRTPVTATSVVGSKPPAAPKPPAAAAAPPQLTPEQQAQQAVQQALAPLYAQQQSDAAARNAAIQQFTQALMQAVAGTPAQFASLVNPQIQGQADLATAASDALKNANPNQTDQQMLSFLGAPDAQKTQVANQLANTFGGGAAVQLFANGQLPVGTLRSQAAGELAQLSQLPGLEGLRGQQAFAQALQQESQAKQAIDAQQPGLVQQYLQQYTSAQNDAADRAEKIREFNVSQGNTNAYRAGLLANDKAKNTLAAGKQSWQQTYQSGLLKLKQQGLITDAQYKNASIALRNKALNQTQAQIALKANGFKTVGNDKTGIYAVRPDGSKTLLIPPINQTNGGASLTSSQRTKLVAELQGHKTDQWVTTTPDHTPLTRGQLVAAAKAAGMNLNDFLNNAKAQEAQGVGLLPALKDKPQDDPHINQVYLDAIRKYGMSRQAAFNFVGKYFPGWAKRNQRSFFPKGSAAQGAAFRVKGATQKDAAAVNLVKEYLGTPYVWGGTSPKGFDCSGLLQYTWGKLGVQIPRTTYTQWQSGTPVAFNDLRPGDAVFFKGSDSRGGLPGHVGMYIGGGRFIEAPHTGATVRISSLRGRTDYVGARRWA